MPLHIVWRMYYVDHMHVYPIFRPVDRDVTTCAYFNGKLLLCKIRLSGPYCPLSCSYCLLPGPYCPDKPRLQQARLQALLQASQLESAGAYVIII